jgi:hypothetical protein
MNDLKSTSDLYRSSHTPLDHTRPCSTHEISEHEPQDQKNNLGQCQESLADSENLSEDAALRHTIFSRRQRIFIVTMTAVVAFFLPLSGQIYYPVIPDLVVYYYIDVDKINLSITIYIILQGITAIIIGI